MTAAITLDMLRSASSGEFPVIDLGAYRRGEARAPGRTAAELRHVLEEIGFVIVVNHVVPSALTDRVVAETTRLHALPMTGKLKRANGARAGHRVHRLSAVGRQLHPSL